MAERFDWQTSDDRADLVHLAVQRLVEGGVVVFPTGTGYALTALATAPDAVARLVELRRSGSSKPLTLAIAGPDQIGSYVPSISPVGRRLIKRCWPGPVTMVFPDGRAEGLPEPVSARVVSKEGLGLRAPAHAAILHALRLLPAPLAFAGANPAAEEPATSAERILETMAERVSIVFDDGLLRDGEPTVIRVLDRGFQMLREGVVSEPQLRRLAGEVIVFVCTGNSCRSPMAEAIFKRMLAEKFGCPVSQLPQRGVSILSAGLAAAPGAPASEHGRQVVREYGASLDDHVAQPLSRELADLSDRLIVMTRDHKQMIEATWPGLEAKTTLLAGEADISDPIGMPIEQYRECAEQIVRSLDGLIVEVEPSA